MKETPSKDPFSNCFPIVLLRYRKVDCRDCRSVRRGDGDWPSSGTRRDYNPDHKVARYCERCGHPIECNRCRTREILADNRHRFTRSSMTGGKFGEDRRRHCKVKRRSDSPYRRRDGDRPRRGAHRDCRTDYIVAQYRERCRSPIEHNGCRTRKAFPNDCHIGARKTNSGHNVGDLGVNQRRCGCRRSHGRGCRCCGRGCCGCAGGRLQGIIYIQSSTSDGNPVQSRNGIYRVHENALKLIGGEGWELGQ